MKKSFALLVCVATLASFCACGAKTPDETVGTTQGVAETYVGFPDAPETFAGMKEADLQPYFELAQETYKRYLLATGLPGLPQFPLQMSPPLQKYTQLRFANETQCYSRYELLSITTSMGEGWLGDWKIIDGKLLCMPCVSIEYRYPGADFDSGSGQGVQMLIEDPRNPTLVDWFDPDKGSWDRLVREGHYDLPDDADPWAVYQWPVSWNLSDPENWLGNCVLKEPADKIFD